MFNRLLTKLNKEDGYVLLSAFIVLLVLISLSAVYVSISLSEIRQVENHENRVQAYYYARSGADIAISKFFKLDSADDIESLKNNEGISLEKKGKLVFSLNNNFKITQNDDQINNIIIKWNDDSAKVDEISIKAIGISSGFENIVEVNLNGSAETAANKFIAIDQDNNIRPYDGNDWGEPIKKFPAKNLNSITWNGEELIAVGDDHTIITLTPDETGDGWSENISNVTGQGANHFKHITWLKSMNKYFAINHNGRIFQKGKDENKWSFLANSKVGNKNRDLESAFGNNKLVMVDESNKIYCLDFDEEIKSKGKPSNRNPSNWSLSYDLKDVAYGNGMFLAVGQEGWNDPGVIYRSCDGKNWEEITPYNMNRDAFNSITYDGSKFIVAGDYDRIITTTDGENWNNAHDGSSSSGYNRHYDNVISYENMILATASNTSYQDYGTNLLSLDGGASWNKYENKDIPKIKKIISVKNGNNNFSEENWRKTWLK